MCAFNFEKYNRSFYAQMQMAAISCDSITMWIKIYKKGKENQNKKYPIVKRKSKMYFN